MVTLFSRQYILGLIALVSSYLVKAQAKIKFEQTELQVTGSTNQVTVFTFTNTGVGPLMIFDVKSLGTGMVLSYTKDPVRPAATGEIKVMSRGASGETSYKNSFEITGNFENGSQTITVTYSTKQTTVTAKQTQTPQHGSNPAPKENSTPQKHSTAGYIWDAENKCQVYISTNTEKHSFKLYKGECSNGYVSGKSIVFINENGEYKYTLWGEFTKGILNGQGVCAFGQGGGKYTGEFKSGFPDGKGTFDFANGDKYEGSFYKNSADDGTMYFKNGSKVNGKLYGTEYNYKFIQNTNRFGPDYFKEQLYNSLKRLGLPKSSKVALTHLQQYFGNFGMILPVKMKEDRSWEVLGKITIDDEMILLSELLMVNMPAVKFGKEGEEYIYDEDSHVLSFSINWSELSDITLLSDNNGFTKITLTGMVMSKVMNTTELGKQTGSLIFWLPDDKAKLIADNLRIASTGHK